MPRTVADASRSYRQRRAEKMARYERALQQIAAFGPVLSVAQDIARNALNPGKEMGE